MATEPEGKFVQRDPELEREAQTWIEAVIGETLDGGYPAGLKDGQALCKLINRLQPGSVRRIYDSTVSFQMMENITQFLAACERYGVAREDLFHTRDLYDEQTTPEVTNGIFALGRKAQSKGFSGPTLGSVSQEWPIGERVIDEEKLREGRNVIGLQMSTPHTGAPPESDAPYRLGRQFDNP